MEQRHVLQMLHDGIFVKHEAFKFRHGSAPLRISVGVALAITPCIPVFFYFFKTVDQSGQK